MMIMMTINNHDVDNDPVDDDDDHYDLDPE